jgi:hypothetical protein
MTSPPIVVVMDAVGFVLAALDRVDAASRVEVMPEVALKLAAMSRSLMRPVFGTSHK